MSRTSLASRTVFVVMGVACLMLCRSFSSIQSSPGRGGGGPTTTLNGDVNCDGEVDISDPVYTLLWLFADGEQPCAFAQEPENSCDQVIEEVRALQDLIETTRPGWPPRPDRIVTVSQTHRNSQDQTPILDVPADRWLVVTGFYALDASVIPSPFISVDLLERDADGNVTGKIHTPSYQAWSDTTGVAFKPGSTLLFSSGWSWSHLQLSGYFAEP